MVNKILKKRGAFLLILVFTITFILVISARTCTITDSKTALKKALYDYLPDPDSSSLNSTELKDFLNFYLESKNLTEVQCDVKATISKINYDVIMDKFLDFTSDVALLKCQDGTDYGECSNIKPKYCFSNQLVNRCSICGCPSGQECQINAGAEFSINEGRWGKCVAIQDEPEDEEVDVSNGLMGYWNFDNNGIDLSGHGNNGAMVGNGKFTENGVKGQAGDFNGIDSYFEIQDSPTISMTEAVSLSVFVYGKQFELRDMLFHKGGEYGLWFGNDFDNTKVKYKDEFSFVFFNRNIGSYESTWFICDSDFEPKLETWYHLAATYDSHTGECKVYVDGKLQKTTYWDAGIPILQSTSKQLRIGGYQEQRYNPNVLIDEARVYNQALSEEEVAEIYQGVVGLQTCSDDTLYDLCSQTKPLYCNQGDLIDNCSICGCSSNQVCQSDGTCLIKVALNSFLDGLLETNLTFNETTENQTIYVQLPSEANVTNATMDITSMETNTSLDVGTDGDIDVVFNDSNGVAQTTPDLSKEINEYISNSNDTQQQEITGEVITHLNENVLVPLTFYADSGGIVEVSDISITYLIQPSLIIKSKATFFTKVLEFFKNLFT